MIAVMLLQEFLIRQTLTKTIPYSEFEQLVDQRTGFRPRCRTDQISGTLKEPGRTSRNISPPFALTPRLADKLDRGEADVSGEPPPGLLSPYLGWLLPSLGFLLVWMCMIRPMTGQGGGDFMAIGKSRAKGLPSRPTSK